MPGTIQVSVLDFEGLPSSSSPSSISMKVSMGKKEYQTWDKGDFSFPLTALRQNLTVRLQDAEGNEISHTDIDTMLVIQKGLLDDIFPLKGGGHVHMKLQFILSEEERNRIRIMRESASKKKQSELSGTALSSLSINKKVSDSQRGLLPTETESFRETANQAGPEQNPVNPNAQPQSGADKIEGTQLDDSSTTQDGTDRSGESLSTDEVSQEAGALHPTELEHTVLVEKSEPQPNFSDVPVKPVFSEGASIMSRSLESVATNSNSAFPSLQEDHADKTKKLSSLRKTPSNVRKMISAFENSQIQEMENRVAPPVTKSQSTKSWKEVLLRDPQKFKEIETWNTKQTQSTSEEARDSVIMDEFGRKRGEQMGSDRSLEKSKAPLYAGQLKELSAKHIQSENEMPSDKNRQVNKMEEKKSFEHFIRKFPAETARDSRTMFNDQDRLQPSNLVTDERDSGGTSVIEKDGVGVQSRFSCEIISQEGPPKPVLYCKDEHFSFERCASCIFPDDTRRLCITTSDKQVMNLMGGDQKKHMVHGSSDIEGKQGQKSSQRARKRFESPADTEPTRGLVRKGIKVAIMAGFGTFVLLTRQRSNKY